MAATAGAMPHAASSRNDTPHHMIADFEYDDEYDYEDFAIDDEEGQESRIYSSSFG